MSQTGEPPETGPAPDTAPLSGAAWPGELRPYQREALAEVDRRWSDGARRTWIVLPPGSGKTLVGLEAARRLGRRTVVLVPNTAIQGQWIRHWEGFDRPEGRTAGSERDLGHAVNVLTYQSLAVFDPDAETDEEGRSATPVRDRLHTNGRALVDALHGAGPLTLLLDECHHLLQVWGRLLAEILDELPDAHVIGLTGTPAASLTATEKDLVDRLFGPPVTGASIPALVRDGYLAPFAELVHVTEPTLTEHEYLAGQAARFEEMCTDLLAPGFATTDFLPWLDARFVSREAREGGRVDWGALAVREPELTDAVLRLHHRGLVALPEGARVRERHRHPPQAEDWTALIGDYARHCLDPSSARDREARDRVRAALPSVGYHLTRNGVRRGASPVDRVLARSAAKSLATVEILAAEKDAVGPRLRALVLCDHERASARSPAALRGVLSDDAGSAWLQVSQLAADPRTRGLDPVLVTGRTVATGPGTSAAFLEFARSELPGVDLALRETDGLHTVEGAWTSRTWVGVVTRFLESGGCQVLVGTRALLGEGWDARGVNTVVDLTTATTPTAVVQSRGRALRLDPAWPEKVAHTWTVVCVSHEHPRGAADWNRFVRKHEGYLGVGADGGVMSGVAHVDPGLSPYDPPEDPRRVNRRMLGRAADREGTRARWRLGTGYADVLLPTLRVYEGRAMPVEVPEAGMDLALPAAPEVLVGDQVIHPEPVDTPPARHLVPTLVPGAIAALCLVFAPLGLGLLAAAAGFGLAALVHWWRDSLRVRRETLRRQREAARVRSLAREPVGTSRYACAVADALHWAGRSDTGAEGVRVHVDTDGVYRFTLADPGSAELFAESLDETLGPLVGDLRYLVPRHVLTAQEGDGTGAGSGVTPKDTTVPVFHAVPSALARNRKGALAFERAWRRWVSRGSVVHTRSEEGRALLAAHFGGSPLEVTTARRLAWE
ncbi:DEAD/DEAH box helicase family protein [Nocardiopsis sp. L17-MgMaSL7]|uniref:DEAD/DEAH box helicase family protein n=1 Tax=Nocardiopsis sp. L17-MgMaSL7 TaxID=1938893 RepID=UPI000D718380|nr:DEAD/DEAH box helicase family protein [Nocardiopsis sp. L17-MgMaSL7]PWV47964.1 helicase-like protein [Nocardiopsis sp. L17-MgMaSL7]